MSPHLTNLRKLICSLALSDELKEVASLRGWTIEHRLAEISAVAFCLAAKNVLNLELHPRQETEGLWSARHGLTKSIFVFYGDFLIREPPNAKIALLEDPCAVFLAETAKNALNRCF